MCFVITLFKPSLSLFIIINTLMRARVTLILVSLLVCNGVCLCSVSVAMMPVMVMYLLNNPLILQFANL